jgi:Zn-dependent M28 family amino/carboxypeptidase
MRNYSGYALFVLVTLFLAMGACSGGDNTAVFDGQAALDYAATQVGFGPRYPGSQGHNLIQTWLQETLTSMGWSVELQSFSYLGVELTNIIARLPSQPSSQTPIILAAHYDTRPQADQDPVDPMQPVLGANDGASGVAILLEIAQVLADQPADAPVWLVFFDGEDSGKLNGWPWIVGSTYFADNMTISPQAVIIVDMVGDRDLQIYYDRNSNPQLSQDIWAVAAELGYHDFIPDYKHAMIDDHTPFVRLGFPAIDIIDFDYPAWHTTEDTMSQISADSLEQVGGTLITWLYRQSR